MKRAHCLSLLLGALVLCTTSWSAQAQLAYRLQRIDDSSSPSYAYPANLNNKGEVVGTTGTRAFHWKNGVYTDLLTATGSTASTMVAAGINDRSIIVGSQNVEPRTFMIRDGRLLPLKISTPDGVANIIAINNRNQIVGRGQAYVFIWERGRTTVLPRLPDSDDWVTSATGINDRGVVAGISGTIREATAVIWKDGAIIPLGVPDNTSQSHAKAINNFDHVVGDGTGWPSGPKAFLWESGAGMRELPPPAGATSSTVSSINDWGAVVGQSTMSQGGAQHATLWISGQAHDLNDLLDANEPLRGQLLLEQALFINERGQVVAHGLDRTNGMHAAYLLTPTYRATAPVANVTGGMTGQEGSERLEK